MHVIQQAELYFLFCNKCNRKRKKDNCNSNTARSNYFATLNTNVIFVKNTHILSYVTDSAGENGFYVSLSRTTKLRAGNKIPFDQLTTNIGNVYDINTSEFTCPRSGVYIFHMSLSCEKGSYLEASIVTVNKDNVVNPVFNTICEHKPESGYYQNGGSAILKLSEGDKVAVKMLYPNYVEETVTGKGLTTFSGYLLTSQ